MTDSIHIQEYTHLDNLPMELIELILLHLPNQETLYDFINSFKENSRYSCYQSLCTQLILLQKTLGNINVWPILFLCKSDLTFHPHLYRIVSPISHYFQIIEFHHIHFHQIYKIKRFISSARPIVLLNYKGLSLTDEHVPLIGPKLVGKSRLTHWNLSHNSFTKDGIQELSHYFEDCSIRFIDLSGNNLLQSDVLSLQSRNSKLTIKLSVDNKEISTTQSINQKMDYMDQILAIDIQIRTAPSMAIIELKNVIQRVTKIPNDFSTCLYKLCDYWVLLNNSQKVQLVMLLKEIEFLKMDGMDEIFKRLEPFLNLPQDLTSSTECLSVAISYLLLGTLSPLFSDKPELHHRISLALSCRIPMIEDAAVYACERIAPHSVIFVYAILGKIVKLLETRFQENQKKHSLDLIRLLRFIPSNAENLNEFIKKLLTFAKIELDVKGLLKVQTILFCHSKIHMHDNVSFLLGISKQSQFFDFAMSCLERYARFNLQEFDRFMDLLVLFMELKDAHSKAKVMHVLYHVCTNKTLLERLLEQASTVSLDAFIEGLLGFSAYGTHSEFPLLEYARAEYKALELALLILQLDLFEFYSKKWKESLVLQDACISYLNVIEKRFDKSCLPAHDSKMIKFGLLCFWKLMDFMSNDSMILSRLLNIIMDFENPLCRVVLESMFCTLQGKNFFSRHFIEFLVRIGSDWSLYHPYKVFILKKTLQVPLGVNHPNRKRIESLILDSLDHFIVNDIPEKFYILYQLGTQALESGWWYIASTLFTFLSNHSKSGKTLSNQSTCPRVQGWISYLNGISRMESHVMSLNSLCLERNLDLIHRLDLQEYQENPFQLEFTKTRIAVFETCIDILQKRQVDQRLSSIANRYKRMAFQYLDMDDESIQVLKGLSSSILLLLESLNGFTNDDEGHILDRNENHTTTHTTHSRDSLIQQFLSKLYLVPKYFFVFEGASILRLGAHPNPFESSILLLEKDTTQVFSIHGQLNTTELHKRKRQFNHCLIQVYQNDTLFGETRISILKGQFQLNFPLLIHGSCSIGIQVCLIDLENQIWTIEPRYLYQIQLQIHPLD